MRLRPGLVVAVLLATGLLGGCQEPRVAQPRSVTASLAGPGGAVNQLDFLDKLEGKPVTTWDEMLAGILLAANKRVGGDYSSRLGQARSFGLVGLDAPANGDTPATPAAFARALLKARGERFDPRASSDDLVVIAQQRGLLPPTIKGNDILSGSVMVGALVAVGEPTARSATPTRTSGPGTPRDLAPRSVRTPPVPAAGTPAANTGRAAAAAAFEGFEDAPAGGGAGPAPVKPAPTLVPIDPDQEARTPGLPRVRPEPVPEIPGP